MLWKLVEKELADRLLDARFMVVLAACVVLSALSIYVGLGNYRTQLREYDAAVASHEAFVTKRIEEKRYRDLLGEGVVWRRRPEVLSPIVRGASGTQGQEITFRHRALSPLSIPHFEGSALEANPAYALFGALDLAFLVKFVLSLAVILFTYDAVSGEKERGTLRLLASFAAPRSTLAAAKIIGSSIAVVVPLVFMFLVATTVLALAGGASLTVADWGRVVALVVVFSLYLLVFTAFGLWASSLTHHSGVAFMILIGVWTAWIFVVPTLGTRAAREIVPAGDFYGVERQGNRRRWEVARELRDWNLDHLSRTFRQIVPAADAEQMGVLVTEGEDSVTVTWGDLSETRQRAMATTDGDSVSAARRARVEREYLDQLAGMETARKNSHRERFQMASVLSAISPLSAVTLLSTDLARTGRRAQEQIELKADVYRANFLEHVRMQRTLDPGSGQLEITIDYTPFGYSHSETLADCLSRNSIALLNLLLLAILGFAGTFVSVLRYDAR